MSDEHKCCCCQKDRDNRDELFGLSEEDEAFDDLVETAKVCLVTRTSYSEVRDWPDVLRNAFIEAYNQLNED